MATGGVEDDVVEYEEGFKMVEKYNIISVSGTYTHYISGVLLYIYAQCKKFLYCAP